MNLTWHPPTGSLARYSSQQTAPAQLPLSVKSIKWNCRTYQCMRQAKSSLGNFKHTTSAWANTALTGPACCSAACSCSVFFLYGSHSASMKKVGRSIISMLRQAAANGGKAWSNPFAKTWSWFPTNMTVGCVHSRNSSMTAFSGWTAKDPFTCQKSPAVQRGVKDRVKCSPEGCQRQILPSPAGRTASLSSQLSAIAYPGKSRQRSAKLQAFSLPSKPPGRHPMIWSSRAGRKRPPNCERLAKRVEAVS